MNNDLRGKAKVASVRSGKERELKMDHKLPSPELKQINRALRRTLKPMLRYISSQRVLNWITHKQPALKGAPFDSAQCDWVNLDYQGSIIPCLRAVPDISNRSNACILYFHGGAYTLGSPAASEAEARRFAISCRTPVYSAQYTTAIHAPYPAAVNDAETAYRALKSMGYASDQIILAGTSAGGGLALALLHRLISKDVALPACCVTLSPWVDLTMSQPSIDGLAKQDVVLSRAWLARAAKLYAGSTACDTPEISPLYGDFAGGPPQLILYSEVEILRDEIIAYAQKLNISGVETTLQEHNCAPHAWPVMAATTPESAQAFDAIADFIDAHRR